MSNLFKFASQAARRAAAQKMRGSGSLLSRVGAAAGSYAGTFAKVLTMPRRDAMRTLRQVTQGMAPGPTARQGTQSELAGLNAELQQMGIPSRGEANSAIERITRLLRSGVDLTTRQKDALAEVAELLSLRFAQPAQEEDDWPEEHDIELLPWEEITSGVAERMAAQEVYTPDSSNVYSYWWEPEERLGPIDRRSPGTLYVTFKSWHPGQRGQRPNSAGPTYAYRSVDNGTYNDFQRQADSSPGGAVWDYLRVRGSVYGHQYQYRLVAGSVIPGGGEYVPRRAAARGLKRRTVKPLRAMGGRPQASQLPQQEWGETTRRFNRQLTGQLRRAASQRRSQRALDRGQRAINRGRPQINRGRP